MSETMMAAGVKARKAPKVLEEIRLKRGMDGNVIATHHYGGFAHDPKPHKLEPTEEAVGAHVAKHMQLEEQGDSEPEPHWTKESA
jgi:hypothetical protein